MGLWDLNLVAFCWRNRRRQIVTLVVFGTFQNLFTEPFVPQSAETIFGVTIAQENKSFLPSFDHTLLFCISSHKEIGCTVTVEVGTWYLSDTNTNGWQRQSKPSSSGDSSLQTTANHSQFVRRITTAKWMEDLVLVVVSPSCHPRHNTAVKIYDYDYEVSYDAINL